MALASGGKLGPYEILAPIGAGGMGEVYRARDSRLARDVAVKVLPTSFAADADRLRRFEQEARATSALNHPNILAIHDIGTHDGAPYVVSEMLEGETLRARIGGAPLPLRKTIDWGAQIARGLAAAHEKGIVHRDLKPDNLFVTKDGRVKILDFGLAKLVGGEMLTEAETNTQGMPGTDAGKVLGTVGYMSPEQVRAQPVDPRSDIFSFGAVLYEMLAGRRAFRGASAVETMNAILKEDPPDLSATTAHLPPALERIVTHCLEKNPEERFQSARDIAFDLEQLSGTSSQAAVLAPEAGRKRPWRRPALIALAAIAIAAGGFVAGRKQGGTRRPEYEQVTFRRGTVREARFAHDGHTIVYAAEWEGHDLELYSTQAGSPVSRSLDLRKADLAAVSSTGEMAVLIEDPKKAGSTLARLPLGGGAPRDILDRVGAADWSPDGGALAAVHFPGARALLEFPLGKVLYDTPAGIGWLRVSPGSDRIAFTEHPVAGDNRGDVAVVDLEGRKTTLSADWEDLGGLAWSRDGREVWFAASNRGANHSLYAVTLSGRLRKVESVPGDLVIKDISRDGKVLFAHGSRRPAILGRAPGATEETDLSWLDYPYSADLSPDGKTLLFSEQGIGGGAGYSTYVRSTDGSPAIRLGKGQAERLSPDGRWALALELGPPPQLVLLPVGVGQPKALPRGPLQGIDWAGFFPDGERILISGHEEGHASRAYVQDLKGGVPKALTGDGVFVGGSPVAPDGQSFVAFTTDPVAKLFSVSGGEPRPIPGMEPGDGPLRWTADGQKLYVVAPGRLPARIYRLDIATGRRELWREIAPADATGVRGIGQITLTPDGSAYFYTVNRVLSALYLAEGLE